MFIITDVPISSGNVWSFLAFLSSVMKLNSFSIISDERFATVVVKETLSPNSVRIVSH